ncbi:MAG: WecB/TagA/CpsF family glycosyltransferase [Candidatus Jacksonbacteria bacterium]|nr:WecB/TagA/CpsF family glycosyltransferase [Candidatus Jacksonbacteria bacterium]
MEHTRQTNLAQVANILGVNIHKKMLQDILKDIEQKICSNSFSWIATVNPEILLKAHKNKTYRKLLNTASLSVADGAGVMLAALFMGEALPARIPGVDLVYSICNIAEKNSKSVFLLGGNQINNQKSIEELHKKYPRLSLTGTAHIDHKNKQSVKTIIKQLSQKPPDVVLVALGAPHQEIVIYKHLSKTHGISLAMGIGGSLDMISGALPRAPKVLRIIGIEWLWRLLLQPTRARRIFNATIVFPLKTIAYWLRIQTMYRTNILSLILDKDKNILIAERVDSPGHWQMPQGGKDKGESLKNTFFREMQEELGSNTFSVHRIVKNFYKYTWPKWHKLNSGYKGQRQSLVIATATDPNALNPDKREFSQLAWVSRAEILNRVHAVRKEATKKALEHLNTSNVL